MFKAQIIETGAAMPAYANLLEVTCEGMSDKRLTASPQTTRWPV